MIVYIYMDNQDLMISDPAQSLLKYRNSANFVSSLPCTEQSLHNLNITVPKRPIIWECDMQISIKSQWIISLILIVAVETQG